MERREQAGVGTPRGGWPAGRRRPTRRAAILGLGAGVAGGAPLLLAGCGGGAGESGAGARPATQTLKDQKVVFLHWWTDSIGPGNNDFMAWAAQHYTERTGGTVEYVDGPAGGGLNAKLITMITGGTPPDATFCSIVFGRDNYDAGMLRTLSPYIAKAADLADKEFFDSSRQFRTKGNDTFGIPVMGPESLTLTINQALFSAAGLDPRGADLKTWDDLIRVGQRLTKTSGDGFAQIGLLTGSLSLPWLAAWLFSNNASLTSADETKYQFDVPATREAVQLSYDLIHKHRLGPRLDDPGRPANARQAFTSGEIAIIYDSSSIRLLNAPPDFRFWILPVPKGPRGTGMASSTWTNFVSVPKDAPHPDAAVEWTRHLTGLEVQVEKLKRLTAASPRVKLYDTPAWNSAVAQEPNLARIPDVARLPGPYPYLRFNRLSAEVAPVLNNILLGQVGVNQGLVEAQRIADQVMAEPVRVQ
ncbi:MAG TPA: extracellular solute-binding protein [Chloroflexota bacterium]|nr:extracellular solute-binding protein [Chloroflexota bacterium]